MTEAYTEREKKDVQFFSKRHGFIFYIKVSAVLISSPMGVWMIVKIGDTRYGLKHHNYSKNVNLRALKGQQFRTPDNWHFQNDKQEFTDIQGVLDYIKRHDTSKQLEEKGIEYMPARTHKQRRYLRDAVQRKRRKDIKNVYKIIDSFHDGNGKGEKK